MFGHHLQYFSQYEILKVGRYSDVWSMGCILYLMLYGHTPFQHISLPMQKFLAIVNPDHVIEYPSHPNKQAVHVIEVSNYWRLHSCHT